ncbi:uncharacterized protein MONBRDRAFT_25024 [Monosiga brevicollis MX1]|uniref:RING-type E3 ubiquitin transferase n=1 Tax=Monosiga brevicollis TaxID=81824 RepID=A9UXJ6_MONBE|nr:uncharacterized protein MONBRDRAFT_25024 [Monosiga brevicollis MX1]EDQ90020.1 predicted protein [Monosiga brevicollis MX1]|eukprot:XP_001745442.1 hypothetical protein [Monosiga brevicollis MX1]
MAQAGARLLAEANGIDDGDLKDPALRSLDGSLRCPICQGYFNHPVLLKTCSHNFCSECIRRHLTQQTRNFKKQCPICSKDCGISDMIPNIGLSHVLEMYRRAKPLLLRKAQAGETMPPATETGNDVNTAEGALPVPSSPPTVASPQAQSKRSKRSARSQGPNAQAEPSVTTPSSKRAKAHAPKTVQCPVCEALVPEKLINQHLDTNCVLITDRKASLRSSPGNGPPSSTPSSSEAPVAPLPATIQPAIATHAPQPPPDLASTATAGAQVAQNVPPPPATETASTGPTPVQALACASTAIASSKRPPMPKMVYALQTPKQLRSVLKGLGLPMDGGKAELTWRHQEYSLLYNAQCDALNPLSNSQLVQEVIRRERERRLTSTQTKGKQLLDYTVRDGAQKIAKGQSGYVRTHAAQFKELLQRARQNLNYKPKSLKRLRRKRTSRRLTPDEAQTSDQLPPTEPLLATASRLPEHLPPTAVPVKRSQDRTPPSSSSSGAKNPSHGPPLEMNTSPAPATTSASSPIIL